MKKIEKILLFIQNNYLSKIFMIKIFDIINIFISFLNNIKI